MAEKKKMRSPKLLATQQSIDNEKFDNFVDGADPMLEGGNGEPNLNERPWENLPSTPKVRSMLLIDPRDKARLDFIAEKTGRSAQAILRGYFEIALRDEAEELYNSMV
ncbi:hypothetical protein [Kiloniella sp.]|uniref:hypothetical protein n=1 Tax=Kiloniella sp. TaxID=1938587 RepID=UPI003B0144CE